MKITITGKIPVTVADVVDAISVMMLGGTFSIKFSYG